MHVRWFRPLHRFRPGQVNHRTHRKVHDRRRGGRRSPAASASPTNGRATPANEHEWRDTHFRIRGPAVDGLRAAFLDNWAETDPELFDDDVDRFPDQPQPGRRGRAVRARRVGDRLERRRHPVPHAAPARRSSAIRITTAYFVPDDEIIDRLCDAADRGVEVEILLPGPHADKRFVQLAGEATYERLLDARRRASGTSSRRCCTPRS